jgi:hypothetical protein
MLTIAGDGVQQSFRDMWLVDFCLFRLTRFNWVHNHLTFGVSCCLHLQGRITMYPEMGVADSSVTIFSNKLHRVVFQKTTIVSDTFNCCFVHCSTLHIFGNTVIRHLFPSSADWIQQAFTLCWPLWRPSLRMWDYACRGDKHNKILYFPFHLKMEIESDSETS